MDGQHLSISSTINEEPSYLKPLDHGARKGVVTFTENIPKRFSFSLKESSEETISVLLRIKPEDKINASEHIVYDEKDNSVTIKKTNKADHSYKYTHVFPPEATQTEIFEKSAKNKIQRLLDGLSSFIFTFGASNSGKTFTVQGDKNNPGLLPRSLVAIFNCLEDFIDVSSPLFPEQASSVVALTEAEISEKLAYKKKIISLLKSMLPQISKSEGFIPYEALADLNLDSEDLFVKEQEGIYSVWLSFYEIYNEKIFDLLDEPKEVRTPLRLVSDKNRVSYIKDLIYIQANSLLEAYQIYLYGRYNLSVSSTAVNDRSSRSHSVFSIKLIGRPKDNRSFYFQHSSFSICDLAGTERANRTRNVGLRLKESQRINASFLVLNKCLRIIRENQSSDLKKLVPYRESKLTQILGPSLTTGEASLTMIVAISQNETFLEETMNTLKSSSVATSIIIHSPPRRKTERKTRFSMAISTCAPGESIGWKALAASQLQGPENTFKHPDGLNKHFQEFKTLYPEGQEPDVYKELLEERKKVLELEATLSKVKENHRKEVENLRESLKRKVSQENTEYLKKQIEEKEEACIEIQIELLRVRKKIRTQGEELEQLVNEKKDLEQLNTKLEELLNDAKEEVELLGEEINTLYDKLNSKDHLFALKEEEVETLKEDKNQLEDQVQTQLEEIQNFEEQIAVLSRDYNNLKIEKENEARFFSKQLQSVQEENELLKKQIEELRKDRRFQVPVIEVSDSDYTPREVKSSKGTRKKANYVLRNIDPPVVKVEGSRRTRSADRRVSSSSEDDPEFIVPYSTGSRSTVKKRTKTKKQLPDYFEDKGSQAASESSVSGTKKQLFLRSTEFLYADSDMSKFEDLNQTQASPETIITRTLRTRKK